MKTSLTSFRTWACACLLGALPLSASAATVINEAFTSSPAANFTVVSGGTWAVSSGRYVLSVPANGTIMGNLTRHNTSVSGDYTLTTTLRITGTSALWNDAAVVFNYVDASNYYFASFNEANDGLTNGIFKVQAGVQTELADFSALSTADTDYAIEVTRAGSSITVKRNGTTLGTASDATFAGGYVGYGSKNDGAQFDNLLVNTAGGDVTAPSAPSGLLGVAASSSQINLSWNASTDNVGVTGYNVYRGGSLLTSVTGTSHSDTGLTASTSYTYKVKARDAANNLSADSNSVTVNTLSSSGVPVEVSSFGPNGTHWPSVLATPFLYDNSVPNIVNVACSWSAISSAISTLTPAQVSAGVLIRVAPGDLPGNGSGSGSTPVLQNLGSTSWTKRVTIAPRDGYGTVTIGISGSIGARIHNVNNVCFAGFIAYSLRPSACNNSAIAWTKIVNWLGVSGSTNMASSNMEFVEVVLPEYSVRDTDSAQASSSTNGALSNFQFIGCYIAPRYRSNGSAHTDTFQFFGDSAYSNMTFKDTAIFASSNCAIQTGGLNGLELRHCYIAAQGPALSRYPFPSGYTPPNSLDVTKTFNGGGTNFKAYDSIFIGRMPYSTSPWTLVSNTVVTEAVALAPGGTGSWTVNASLTSTVPDDFGVTLPTDAYLNSIWQ
ncbi:hypothetical protein CMV30_16485 [Nibricoccus aquaticus]|uniref:Fibronectin type-III domain-containing protein n=1 Tax=Nibricoccus aquaticus TaxID=2576891 RepID=A0A290QLQ1_9BACT|nr:hypothetical protein [Nibricoccus aquaticus]ATC65411.1 hypothetical protein CMV30_16485 [Nibricoccus aquaticus]